MAKMIWHHCAAIKLLENVTPHYQDDKGHVKKMIYRYNMTAQKSTSNMISDTNKWSHSSARSKQTRTTKNENQQR